MRRGESDTLTLSDRETDSREEKETDRMSEGNMLLADLVLFRRGTRRYVCKCSS